jgi:hypothetical protein
MERRAFGLAFLLLVVKIEFDYKCRPVWFN